MLKVYSNSIIGTNLLDIINTSSNTPTVVMGNSSTNAYSILYNNQNFTNSYIFGKYNSEVLFTNELSAAVII